MALHIQAALNGSRSKSDHINVPVTIQELTQDAAEVVKAGAGSIHLHPRDTLGKETLHPDIIAETLLKLRTKVKVPIGISTGEWIEGPKTPDMIRNWTVLPDFASVNIHEENAVEIISLLRDKSIGVEAGVWTLESAHKLIKMGITDSLRVLIEPMESRVVEAIDNARSIWAELKKNKVSTPLLLHGQNETTWKVLAFARTMGLSSRMGFEDTLWLPGGKQAGSNRELVEAALDQVEFLGGAPKF